MANVPKRFKSGVQISGTAQVDSDDIATLTASQTLQNKTIDSSNSIDAAALPSNIDAANIADGSVSNTEFQYINGLTSDAQTQLNAKIDSSEKGAANGVATLDGSGKLPASQLTVAAMEYQGTWAASTNTPSLADGVGNTGDLYVASDAGTVDFGSGNITFAAGDHVIYNGTIWEKSINSNAVASVNGQTGVVVLDADDIDDAATTNKFATASQLAKVDFLTVTQAVDLDAMELDVADLTTLSGVVSNSTNLGTFTGTTLGDTETIKSAFQTLETSLESIASGGANTSLSNLGLTAINASLLFDTANAYNIGSNSADVSRVYTRAVYRAASNSAVIDVQNFQLLGTGGAQRLSFETGLAAKTNLDMETHAIINVVDPTNAQDAATKNYVDTQISGISTDASGITYTPAVLTDWNGDADPGNTDDALDQLAERVDDNEIAIAGKAEASAGDIAETSFAAANNVVAAANVTGLAFANGTVRSFEALVSVFIDATTDLYEVFTLKGIQKGASWDMSVDSTGDVSNISFSITSAGQVQYTSGNEAGFVSSTMKFRAITTSV